MSGHECPVSEARGGEVLGPEKQRIYMKFVEKINTSAKFSFVPFETLVRFFDIFLKSREMMYTKQYEALSVHKFTIMLHTTNKIILFCII